MSASSFIFRRSRRRSSRFSRVSGNRFLGIGGNPRVHYLLNLLLDLGQVFVVVPQVPFENLEDLGNKLLRLEGQPLLRRTRLAVSRGALRLLLLRLLGLGASVPAALPGAVL